MHYNTILTNNLTIIDQTAIILAREHGLPIHVFDFDEKGTSQQICAGRDTGTLVADVESDVLES